jgi:hypothetical protein
MKHGSIFTKSEKYLPPSVLMEGERERERERERDSRRGARDKKGNWIRL